IIARFFHEKTAFVHDEVGKVSQVDYIKDLTIVAVIGEFGFGKVIGVGEYLLDPSNNMAEVAFSVSKDFKKKGLGKILMTKLCQAAREKGISGLFAYTSHNNKGMINLFSTLPFQIKKSFEDDMVLLKCSFENPLAENVKS
ncbi:MAG: GNAT family N-acetyltransferase, partial [Deltaproteobacteria bacterium]|nr:GNAT family N-acetyltransferase [Deltaproteobacteria bacterium]